MVTIIVTGHGNFATGLLSARQLIAGTNPAFAAVDFLATYSTDRLRTLIEDKVACAEKEIVILTDLMGGSPYNESVKLKTALTGRYQIEVLAGTNLAMLLTASFVMKEKAAEVAALLIKEGQQSITQYVKKNHVERVSDEDGI